MQGILTLLKKAFIVIGIFAVFIFLLWVTPRMVDYEAFMSHCDNTDKAICRARMISGCTMSTIALGRQ